jgi:hypothetical protein
MSAHTVHVPPYLGLLCVFGGDFCLSGSSLAMLIHSVLVWMKISNVIPTVFQDRNFCFPTFVPIKIKSIPFRNKIQYLTKTFSSGWQGLLQSK